MLGQALSVQLLNNRSAIASESKMLYAALKEFATLAEELATADYENTAKMAEGISDHRRARVAHPFHTGVPWARGLDDAAFTRRVLTTEDAGTDEDVLYLAQHASRLTASFKEEFGSQSGWGADLGNGKPEFLAAARRTDKYKQADLDLSTHAETLEREYASWKEQRDKELDGIMVQKKDFLTSITETNNRVASHMVISQVLACAILAATLGEPRPELTFFHLDHPFLEDSFVQRMQTVLSQEIRVSRDAERDVAKLSELCVIMLSLVESTV